MMWPLRFALTLVAMFFSPAQAAVSVEVCFNYGCAARAVVRVDDAALTRVGAMFATVSDPVGERETIARAIAKLYRIAGGQTPIFADRAGNLLDDGIEGRMDCIDHSTTTSVLLHLLADQGWLGFHRVLEPKRRTRFLFQHFSAAIEEVGSRLRFAVDSWFVEHGEPAVILPLDEWLKGGGPRVH